MDIDDIKRLVKDLLTEPSSRDKGLTFKRKINNKNIKANINIEGFDKTHKKDRNSFYWINKLEDSLTYRNDLSQTIRPLVLNIYSGLCQDLEEKLSKSNTSIEKIQLGIYKRGYKFNLYNKLYSLCEALLIERFEGQGKKINSALGYIRKYTNKEISDFIYERSRDLSSNIKIDDRIKKAFELNDRGLKIIFIDRDGSKRAAYNFTREQNLAIALIKERENALYSIKEATDLVADIFFSSLNEIFNKFPECTKMMTTYLSPYTLSKNLLDALLLISEARVRSNFEIFADIDVSSSMEIFYKNNLAESLEYIIAYQKSYMDKVDRKIFSRIYDKYLTARPNKIKARVSYLTSLSMDERIDKLHTYSKDTDIKKLASMFLKEEETDNKILGLYLLYKNELNTKKTDKYLFKIIREDNYSKFKDLIASKDLSQSLVDEILDLSKPSEKIISIDSKKLEESKKDLGKIVRKIEEFTGDDRDIRDYYKESENIGEDKENISSDDKKETLFNDLEEKFIRSLLANDRISEKDANKLLEGSSYMLSSILAKINDKLYEKIGDQSIYLDGGKVYIDPYYVEDLKEIINGQG